MQLCRDWSRSDCSEGGESSKRGRTGPKPAPGPCRLRGGRDGRENVKCPFLFPFRVSPTSCWEACINSAKAALLLRVLFPCCIKMHRSFSVYLLVLQRKEVVFTAEKASLSQKHYLASQSADSYTCLPDILILIQVLKITSWQENFLLSSQLLTVLERHMQYFVVPLSCHRVPCWERVVGSSQTVPLESVCTSLCPRCRTVS